MKPIKQNLELTNASLIKGRLTLTLTKLIVKHDLRKLESSMLANCTAMSIPIFGKELKYWVAR